MWLTIDDRPNSEEVERYTEEKDRRKEVKEEREEKEGGHKTDVTGCQQDRGKGRRRKKGEMGKNLLDSCGEKRENEKGKMKINGQERAMWNQASPLGRAILVSFFFFWDVMMKI